MNFYILSLIFSLLIATVTALATLKKRNVGGAKAMIFLMSAIASWSFCYIFELTAKGLSEKLIWYNFEYFGIAVIPLLWFIFALQYSDMQRFLSVGSVLLLAIIPVVTIIMVWTNPFHGFMIRNIVIAVKGPITLVSKTNGPWYWVNVGYSYILTLAGSIILLRSVVNLPRFYIKQGIVLILGVAVPLIGNILYVFNLNLWKPFDITPITFAFSGIALSWSLFNLKMFEIVPVARNKVFDHIDDGIIVINEESRIVDINQSMLKILKTSFSESIGQLLEVLLLHIKGSLSSDDLIQLNKKEIELEVKGVKRNYDITTIPIKNKRSILTGQLVIFHDITNIKETEKILSEQADRDSLTGVYNRRFFNRLIEKETERSKRYNHPITFIMADVNNFKEINDRFGHQVGDIVLIGIGQTLNNIIRKVDTVIRYGGDEFLLVLPEICDDKIDGFITRIHESVEKWNTVSKLSEYGVDFNIGLSIGVSCYQPNLDESIDKILHYADMDMYRNKKTKP
jgi:diguanylate cyclase (GGDEF)-like protein/PAS domain S-box-containing protein